MVLNFTYILNRLSQFAVIWRYYSCLVQNLEAICMFVPCIHHKYKMFWSEKRSKCRVTNPQKQPKKVRMTPQYFYSYWYFQCVVTAKTNLYLVNTIAWLSLLHKFYECSDVKEFMQWELILMILMLTSPYMFYCTAKLAVWWKCATCLESYK